MKRFLCAGLCMVLCAGIFAGCGTKLESDTSALYVSPKGVVTALEVEELDQDYYDAKELETYVKDEVAEYTAEHGKGSVKVEDLSVDETTAKLRMKYKTTEDYSNFNGIELYAGKVIDTIAAGYTYDVDLVKVEDGKMTDGATKQEVYQEDGLKAVIIRANTKVQVDGDICYVSSENVELTGTNEVSITDPQAEGSFETDVYTYIIYK